MHIYISIYIYIYISVGQHLATPHLDTRAQRSKESKQFVDNPRCSWLLLAIFLRLFVLLTSGPLRLPSGSFTHFPSPPISLPPSCKVTEHCTTCRSSSSLEWCEPQMLVRPIFIRLFSLSLSLVFVRIFGQASKSITQHEGPRSTSSTPASSHSWH